MTRKDHHLRPRLLCLMTRHLVLVTVAIALTACFGDGAEQIQAQVEGDDAAARGDYPAWIEKLYPPPGSEASVTQAVQVDHNVVAADQQVRLIIDGTDVTSYAVATSPGLLEYDIDQPRSPVDLQPGEHTAVVELKRVTPGDSEGVDSYDPQVHATVDRFTWTFTIL